MLVFSKEKYYANRLSVRKYTWPDRLDGRPYGALLAEGYEILPQWCDEVQEEVGE